MVTIVFYDNIVFFSPLEYGVLIFNFFSHCSKIILIIFLKENKIIDDRKNN